MQAPLRADFRRRTLTIAGIVLAAGALAYFASRIPHTLAVFIVAAFIAFGVGPLVARLERRIARPLAIAVVYVALIAFVIVLAVLVVPATLTQLQVIGYNFPGYVATAQSNVDGAQNTLRRLFGRAYLPQGTGDLRALIASRISLALDTSVASLAGILVSTLTAAFIAVSALVLSAFFVLRGDHVIDPAYNMLPESQRETARRLGTELAQVFGGYVSGQALLCAVTGFAIVVLSALTGFKYALLLGIVAGIAYAVPFVGMVVAHVVALVLAFPQGASVAIEVQLVVFVVARVADNVLVPKIMGQSVGVSPIVVMFSVFAGGELFGLPGLLLGIPAAAVVKVAWRFYREQRGLAAERLLEEAAVSAHVSGAATADPEDLTARPIAFVAGAEPRR